MAGAPRDSRSAARHFEAAAEAGHPWAQFRLAQMLDTSGANRAGSLELKTAAAGAGVAEAAALLGTQHREGRGGVPRDAAEAARWFTVAAESGVPEAQYNLGLMHYRSEGMPRQLARRSGGCRQAAANGHVPAQRAVGRLYLTGLDSMGRDFREARTWLASAASQGNRESQRLLADLDRAQAADRIRPPVPAVAALHGRISGLRPLCRLLVAALWISRSLRVLLTAHRLLRFQVTLM